MSGGPCRRRPDLQGERGGNNAVMVEIGNVGLSSPIQFLYSKVTRYSLLPPWSRLESVLNVHYTLSSDEYGVKRLETHEACMLARQKLRT